MKLGLRRPIAARDSRRVHGPQIPGGPTAQGAHFTSEGLPTTHTGEIEQKVAKIAKAVGGEDAAHRDTGASSTLRQNSVQALRYRKDIRSVSGRIPVDIIPLKEGVTDDPFIDQIGKGETIYER